MLRVSIFKMTNNLLSILLRKKDPYWRIGESLLILS